MKLASLRAPRDCTEEHNFMTGKCSVRSFTQMETRLKDQIKSLKEPFDSIADFKRAVYEDDRHDLERVLRAKGKNYDSVIGVVNTGVESFEFVLGGPLHNEIGITNNILDQLINELSLEGLDAEVAAGGAGCTPAQHHGGKYNGGF